MLFWLIPAGLLGWYLFTRKPAASPGGGANLLGTGAINRVTQGATLFSIPPFGNNGAMPVTSVSQGETVKNAMGPPGSNTFNQNVRQRTPDGTEWILVEKQNGQSGFIPIALLVGAPEQLTGTTLEPGKLYEVTFDLIGSPPVSSQAEENARAEQIRLAMAERGFRLVGGLQQLPSLPIGPLPPQFRSQGVWTGAATSIFSYLNGPLSTGRLVRVTGLAPIQ